MRKDGGADYALVRGLTRGLDLLRAINVQEGGRSSLGQLAEVTGLHRTTVRRLLETLISEGYVRRSESDDRYCLTLHVRSLAEGFRDEDWISSIAAPALSELLQTVVWPSDLTTPQGAALIIRESTHRFSPLSFHRAMVDTYGWADAQSRMSFFGPIAPDMLTVRVGPEPEDTIQVPFGQFKLPNIDAPIVTAKLGTTEEWTLKNVTQEEHPFHIHVNDFQSPLRIFGPDGKFRRSYARRANITIEAARDRARRMGGGDKPMKTIAGRTILERVIERLKPQCDQIILNANGYSVPYGKGVAAAGPPVGRPGR